jgi:hypothetical protein
MKSMVYLVNLRNGDYLYQNPVSKKQSIVRIEDATGFKTFDNAAIALKKANCKGNIERYALDVLLDQLFPEFPQFFPEEIKPDEPIFVMGQ